MKLPRWLRNVFLPDDGPPLAPRHVRREEAGRRPRSKGQRFWGSRDRHELPLDGREDPAIHGRGW